MSDALASAWTLDPSVHYLNHGSFGATPRAVLERQAALRAELEREPVDFIVRRLPGRLAEVRDRLGAFMHADPEGFAFVPNATTGVNAALRSWPLSAGDEVLTTDHAYAACRKAAAWIAERRGARLVTAAVPFPLRGEDDVVEAVMSAVTPRTRVALLDHVTSPTALIFPISRLVTTLRERGVETIVDGAHTLGMLPLELDRLGAACYTTNAHKWLCAPKVAAVLWVRRDLRDRIRPLIVSHGYDPVAGGLRFREEWDWTGTMDPTTWLCIPECLRVMEEMVPGGWPEIMRRNHELAVRARGILLAALGLEPPCPEAMLGSMATIPLPARSPESAVVQLDPEALAAWTRERGIEGWFWHWPAAGSGKLTRVSAQLYNHEAQYEALRRLLPELLR
ncbi:MAG: aminotransferase class V-fold PLP-dependent enzyme [Candidatus Polarisedimenticolia bacterium]